jgi:hypothetical protein
MLAWLGPGARQLLLELVAARDIGIRDAGAEHMTVPDHRRDLHVQHPLPVRRRPPYGRQLAGRGPQRGGELLGELDGA